MDRNELRLLRAIPWHVRSLTPHLDFATAIRVHPRAQLKTMGTENLPLAESPPQGSAAHRARRPGDAGFALAPPLPKQPREWVFEKKIHKESGK